MRAAALAAALVLVSGCTSFLARRRPREPIALSQGAIVGSVVLRGHEFPNVIPHTAQEMFFAQIGRDAKPDLDHPVSTNYFADGQVFLLDIPPGRYAPLTVSYYKRGLRYQARLAPEDSRLWTVDVNSGQIAFLGANTLRTEWQGFGKDVVDFLKKLVAFLPGVPRLTTPVEISTPRLERSPKVEAHALRRARESLKGSLWVDAIDRRLIALGNPPEPLTTGLIFKKAKPKLGEGAFKYVETLGWGEPKPAPGGLRWLEPHDKAEITVSFMTPEVPGYKPRERYLDDMRAAGSEEDAHTLSAVMISSRAAQVARYTSYIYPKDALVGSVTRVYRTETLLVPAFEGYYIMRYRAERASFGDFYDAYKHFIQYVEFEIPLQGRSPVEF